MKWHAIRNHDYLNCEFIFFFRSVFKYDFCLLQSSCLLWRQGRRLAWEGGEREGGIMMREREGEREKEGGRERERLTNRSHCLGW